jgi:hypothetical protein
LALFKIISRFGAGKAWQLSVALHYYAIALRDFGCGDNPQMPFPQLARKLAIRPALKLSHAWAI